MSKDASRKKKCRRCEYCGDRLKPREWERHTKSRKPRQFCDRKCYANWRVENTDWKKTFFTKKRKRKIAKAAHRFWDSNTKRVRRIRKELRKRMRDENPMFDRDTVKRKLAVQRRHGKDKA